MSSSTSSDSSAPNLNKVMAAVGTQVFSFLPMGNILRGSLSPMLVNTIFHDNVFQYFGQSKSLSLSSCRHLRNITDDHLIILIRNIIEITEASNPDYSHTVERRRPHVCSDDSEGICSCSIKVTHLDLSRCRMLKGEGIYFCLRHMPHIERILLSSVTRFDVQNFLPESDIGEVGIPRLRLHKLSSVVISDCKRIDNVGVRKLIREVNWKYIRHLDLSNCSTLIDDNIVPALLLIDSLEVLSLAGSKLTDFGVGVLCHVYRHTLRSLSLCGCEEVNLPRLLMATHSELTGILAGRDPEMIFPTNVFGRTHPYLPQYSFMLNLALIDMTLAHDDREQLTLQSQRNMVRCKDIEKRYRGVQPEDGRIFNRIKKLDLGLIGKNRGIRLEGCIACISWLTGGNLVELNLFGLEHISDNDLEVLALTNTPRGQLQSLRAGPLLSSFTSIEQSNAFLRCFKRVSEFDLFYCSLWDGLETTGGMRDITDMTNLRSLILDNTSIDCTALERFLISSSRLLKLGLSGVPEMKSSILTYAKRNNENLQLLELDIREVELDIPLCEVRKQFSSLLRLNNRCTELGTKLLKAHRSDFLYRVGGTDNPSKSKRKRNRSGTASSSTNNEEAVVDRALANCCSILRTGFSASPDSEQEIFSCRTCGIECGRFVCLNCVSNCHKGHEVVSAGYGVGYCDCSLLSTCKCMNQEEE